MTIAINLSLTDPTGCVRSLHAGLAAILLLFGAGNAAAQVGPTEADTIAQFQRAAADYAFLHRRVERHLAPVEVTANSETLRRAIDAMATAMRAARPDARQDDLFAPAVREVLRTRVARALREHSYTTADVHAAEMAEGIDPRTVTLRVNGPFPWTVATAMLPCILETLPALPPELQYRLVGNDLVLIDVHASLIVDILPSVLEDENTYVPGGV